MKNSSERRLFLASFLTLIAAGIGFSVRGAILGDWSKQFGFTQSELGTITGGGLLGFGFTIIILSFVADRIGYGPLMVLAFLLHLSSAIVTLAASPVFDAMGKDAAYQCLYYGALLFSLGNGTCEAVINPLTATLYPHQKTHWLNILHAGWPGGLILGALLALVLSNLGARWEIQIAMYVIPTLIYGILMLGQRFPTSEAAAAGVSFGTMLLEFTSPILLFLLLIHAMIGYVELGTDSWITNITGTILDNRNYALMLFIWANGLMFALRFFAGPIVHKISPLGLLFAGAIIACIGLSLLGRWEGWMICVAATIYAVGKTFFWPTMLGVVSERFPRGGAVTLGMIGGVGMLSAGLLGGPGIGYEQDYYASHNLQEKSQPTFERYVAREKDGKIEEKSFLVFPKTAGLDGSKVATLLGKPGEENGGGKLLAADIEVLQKSGRTLDQDENLKKLNEWWQGAKQYEQQDQGPVKEATLFGGKHALQDTALIPATMAVCYGLLILYFRLRGGYKAEVLVGHKALDEEFTGGVPGPAEL